MRPIMSLLQWDGSLSLGHPQIDATHAEFVERVNALEVAAEMRSGIEAALEALAEHLVGHFAQEERWLVELGAEPQNCHYFQHLAVLNVMREVQRLYAADGNLGLVQRLASEIATWFDLHARSLDAALVQALAQRAGSGAAAIA